jgi:hypothetical protein
MQKGRVLDGSGEIISSGELKGGGLLMVPSSILICYGRFGIMVA